MSEITVVAPVVTDSLERLRLNTEDARSGADAQQWGTPTCFCMAGDS